MKLSYQIQFLSEWHCGSGLSSGPEADAEVLKDQAGLPYIPGKTIKGLLKDALNEMPHTVAGVSKEQIDSIFGFEIIEKGRVTGTEPGSAFFSSAALPEIERNELSKDLTEFLYKNKAATAIDKKGIAAKSSLRTIEVCMPITLQGYIDELNETQIECIKKALKWVRHIGVNRNRGLGRCKITAL